MFTTKRARVQASPTCSFCGKDKEDVTVLVERTPSASVCDECLALCLDILDETDGRRANPPTPPHVVEPESARQSKELGGRRDAPQCSFCDKTENAVLKLIADPDVYICNECIDRYESNLRDAVDRGELGQSPFGVYYTACQAIIEIRLNFKSTIRYR